MGPAGHILADPFSRVAAWFVDSILLMAADAVASFVFHQKARDDVIVSLIRVGLSAALSAIYFELAGEKTA